MMRPTMEEVRDEASRRWAAGSSYVDALSLAAGAGMAVWIDPDGCELLGLEPWPPAEEAS